VAGDFGKWAQASLENPAFAAFLETPEGAAWRRRIEQDRPAYLEALARAIVVEAAGDLYAYDPELSRWHRVTRTGGAVVGGLAHPGSREIAYVTRRGTKAHRELAVGVIDLARGRTTRTVRTGTPGPIIIGHRDQAPAGFYVGVGARRPSWRVLQDGKLVKPPRSAHPSGPRVEISGHVARLQALPIATVTADWDDQGLASAMRIGSSNRVVSVPSPGLIDGNTVTWSPDRSHLAFVAQLDERCTPGTARAAVYTADAATGAVALLFTATPDPTKVDTGLAVEWMTDRRLLVASAAGVTIVSLGAPDRAPLVGATELITPRPRPRCTPQLEEDAPTIEDPEVADPPSGESADAGVVGPR
jgi:hypothetical protein